MGIYLTDLADVLRDGGLDVVEVEGWQRRGFKTKTTPDGGLVRLRGGLVHHTATPAKIKGDYPTLGIIVHGRSDVPGPLSQLGLGRSGTWYVCAAGRANHSGAVDNLDYSNPYSIGVEAEHPGGGEPWPGEQYLSYITGCSVLSKEFGISWRGHKEAAVPAGRKVDPTFDMSKFRASLTTKQANAATKKGEEDDMFSDEDRYRDRLTHEAVGRLEVGLYVLRQELGRVGDVDEEKVAAAVLAGLPADRIAEILLERGIGPSVADYIAQRLSGDAA